MSKQKQKRDDYKGYYPDEMKGVGKGGFNKRQKTTSFKKENGDRKTNFQNKGQEKPYSNSRYSKNNSREHINTNNSYFEDFKGYDNDRDFDDIPKSNRKENYSNKEKVQLHKNQPKVDKVDKVYAMPVIKEENGKTLYPIEFSRYGLSTIKMLSLDDKHTVFAIDGKTNGPKTALIVNDRDPEKGFKAVVILNVDDYIILQHPSKSDDNCTDVTVYQVKAVATRETDEQKLGYCEVVEIPDLSVLSMELTDEILKTLNTLSKDLKYVYAIPKQNKKVQK